MRSGTAFWNVQDRGRPQQALGTSLPSTCAALCRGHGDPGLTGTSESLPEDSWPCPHLGLLAEPARDRASALPAGLPLRPSPPSPIVSGSLGAASDASRSLSASAPLMCGLPTRRFFLSISSVSCRLNYQSSQKGRGGQVSAGPTGWTPADGRVGRRVSATVSNAAVITCGQISVRLDEHQGARLLGHRARVCLLLGEADTVLQRGHGICTPPAAGPSCAPCPRQHSVLRVCKHPNRCAAVCRFSRAPP